MGETVKALVASTVTVVVLVSAIDTELNADTAEALMGEIATALLLGVMVAVVVL